MWHLCTDHVITKRFFFWNNYYVDTRKGRIQLDLIRRRGLPDRSCDRCLATHTNMTKNINSIV